MIPTLAKSAALLTVALAGCAQPSPGGGDPLQGALVDTRGRRWIPKEYQGTILLEFWSASCSRCIRRMPEMHAMYEELHPYGLDVISVNTDLKRETAEAFIQRHPFPNPVVVGNNRAWKAWNVKSLPTVILIRKGQVLGRWEGSLSVREIKTAVRSLF